MATGGEEDAGAFPPSIDPAFDLLIYLRAAYALYMALYMWAFVSVTSRSGSARGLKVETLSIIRPRCELKAIDHPRGVLNVKVMRAQSDRSP
eukprot:309472-Prorocentrum_minimum.AAC.1